MTWTMTTMITSTTTITITSTLLMILDGKTDSVHDVCVLLCQVLVIYIYIYIERASIIVINYSMLIVIS